MKLVNLAYTFGIIMIAAMSSSAKADMSVQTAMTNCREEAASTGLENEAAIKEYVDLCMQAWQSPSEYTEGNPTSEETNEPPVDTQESPAEN